MLAYKGFNRDLTCTPAEDVSFQYEIGKIYETSEEPILCDQGFHACEMPFNALAFYPPSESRYCEVELQATEEIHYYDTKRVGNSIKILKELDLDSLIKEQSNYIVKNKKEEVFLNTSNSFRDVVYSKKNFGMSVNQGTDGVAANVCAFGAAINEGIGGVSVNTGIRSISKSNNIAINTGTKSLAHGRIALATGNWSTASAETGGVAIICGEDARAKGKINSWLIFIDIDTILKNKITNIKTVYVDGEIIKENTYYKLSETGEVEEVL